MWKSKCKKTVSICTVFAVLFSSVAGLSGLIAQSAQNSYTINQVQTVPTDRGDNLLVGKKATYSRRANGEEVEKAKTVANEAAYTDKKPSAAEPDLGNGGYIEYTADQGSAYIIYDLGGVCEISDVLVMSRTTNGDYYPKKYNVRIADTEEELFSDIACKISYRNHEKKVGQLFSYTGNKPCGKYIAFEFPKAAMVRIGELAVYGTAGYSVYGYDKKDITSATDSDIPSGSLISGKNYTLYTNKGAKIPNDALETWGENGTTFTDGKVAAGSAIGCNYEKYGPMCFVYDLGGTYTIDRVLQISRAMSPTRAAVAYNVRIADSVENLFQAGVYSVNYTAEDKNNPTQGQLLTFNTEKQPSGRYVAFEILDASPVAGDDSARIAELAVYGELVYNQESITSATDADIPSGSLISGKNYTLYTNKGAKIPNGALETWGENGTTFTDGKVAASSSIGCNYAQYGPMCFVYDLGGVYTVERALQISRAMNPTRAAVAYNVRVADSVDNLFNGNAHIVNYTAEDKDNPPQGQLLTFKDGKQPVGRYVAFEMLDASAYPDDDNARIAELGVYGVPNYDAYDKKDITSATDADIPSGSLIAGKDYKLYTNKGEEIPNNALDSWGSNGTYTDGKIVTDKSVGCSYEQYGPMCFVYDLGGAYTIEKILQISRDLSPNRAVVAYNVRVADSVENLFKAGVYIVNYIAEDKTNPVQGQLLTFKTDKQPVGRYVAFEILDASPQAGDDSVRIAELAVYGTKFQEEEPGDYGCETYMSLSNSFYHLYRKDLKEEWVPYLKYQALKGGGLRYNFSNPQPGVGSDVSYGQARGAYSEAISLEGVELQFDRLDAVPSETNTYFTITAAGLIGVKTDSYTGTGDQYNRGAISFNFDYTTGAVTAAAGGGKNAGTEVEIEKYQEQVIAPNDTLKLENLKGKPFKVFIHRSGDEEFELRVTVDDIPISGTFTDNIIATSGDYTWGIKDVKNVYIGLAGGWDGDKLQTYSIDFIGLTNVEPPQYEVIDLIDEIGTVTLDKEAAIELAQQKYDALSDYEKTRIINVDALDAAQNSLSYLKQNEESIVDDTIAAINKIGTVTKRSGADLREAERLYSRLSAAQRAKVKNADKLEKALTVYYKLVAPEYEYDAVLYSPNDRLRRFSDEELKEIWQDCLTMEVTERGGLLFHWKDAIRDMRNGVGGILDSWQNIFHLNNLSFQVSNITPDTTITDGVGAKLNIQIGNAFDGYGGLRGTEQKNLSLVLDTVEGEVRAYPGGGLVVKDEVLKYEPGDKDYVFEIRKTDDELYRLFITVNGKNISGIIPSSVMGALEEYMEYPDEPSRLRVELSPWVNNERAIADNSKHTFSAELVSVQDSGRFAFEQIDDVITLFNTLPNKATEDNIDDIQSIYQQYRALPYALRSYVTNYGKMSDLLAQMHKMSAADNLDWFDEADIAGNDGDSIGAATGDTSKIALFTVIAAVAAAVLVLAAVRLKYSKKNHDIGEDA